jgi:hypothetical protein
MIFDELHGDLGHLAHRHARGNAIESEIGTTGLAVLARAAVLGDTPLWDEDLGLKTMNANAPSSRRCARLSALHRRRF